MGTDEAAVGVFQHGDGILLIGTSVDVQALAERFDASSKSTAKLTPDLLLAAGAAFYGLSEAQAQSGRWMKLTAESATTLREAGITASTKDGLLAGVARGPAGSIVGHLRFEPAALATPAAPMVLAATATAMALRQAAKEMTDYLEAIDIKVEQHPASSPLSPERSSRSCRSGSPSCPRPSPCRTVWPCWKSLA